MRIYEIASAQEQLELLKLIMTNTWTALAQQAQQERQAKAQQQQVLAQQLHKSKRAKGVGSKKAVAKGKVAPAKLPVIKTVPKAAPTATKAMPKQTAPTATPVQQNAAGVAASSRMNKPQPQNQPQPQSQNQHQHQTQQQL
jgi:hypothetical protein